MAGTGSLAVRKRLQMRQRASAALAVLLLCARYAIAVQAQGRKAPPKRGLSLRFWILLMDKKSAPAPALYRVWEQAHAFW
jgi:hypothetical protein